MASVQRRRRMAGCTGTVGLSDRSVNRRHAFLSVAACSLLASAAVADAAPAPAVLGADGNASLEDISGHGLRLSMDRRLEAKTFQFHLPSDAQQGPDTWYTIHLDVSATFAPDSPPGSVLVSGLTNGKATAQVNFYAERDRDGGPVTSWNSLDIFNGDREGEAKGHSAHTHFENVLQFSGVKPGLNTLTFTAEVFGKADVAAIEIGPGSGIYSTKAGPIKLKIAGEFQDDSPEVGEATKLEVRVINRSPRPAEGVAVLVQPKSDHLFIDGPIARRITELDGSATTHFTVGRTRPGKMAVIVSAATPLGEEASATVAADVTHTGKSSPVWPLILSMSALAATAIWLIRRHKQQEESK